MIALQELLDYWRKAYPIGYSSRLPATNDNILSTIHYLEELQKIKGGEQ